jgi:hypothetical protein
LAQVLFQRNFLFFFFDKAWPCCYINMISPSHSNSDQFLLDKTVVEVSWLKNTIQETLFSNSEFQVGVKMSFMLLSSIHILP